MARFTEKDLEHLDKGECPICEGTGKHEFFEDGCAMCKGTGKAFQDSSESGE